MEVIDSEYSKEISGQSSDIRSLTSDLFPDQLPYTFQLSHFSFFNPLHLRAMPAAGGKENFIHLLRSPGAFFVGVNRAAIADDFLHDAPPFLDDILSGKEGLITANGIADESFVGGHLIGLLIDNLKFHRFADHPFAVDFDLHANADREGYRVAQKVLEGKEEWLQQGIL